MTTRVLPWGLLISASLPTLSACSAAPPAAAAPVIEPQASAAPPPPPVVPSGPLGLGPLVRLSGEEAPPVASTRTFFGTLQQRAFFGHGSLVSVLVPSWSRAPKGCPILDTKEVCGAYTLTVTDQDPSDERWRTGEAPSKSVTRTIVAPYPASWNFFSGGREGVYAFPGSAAGVIDLIDDKGAVSPFLQSDSLGELQRLVVVELGEKRIVVGHGEGAPLQVAEVTGTGASRVLGSFTELGMAAVPSYRKSAQGARQVEETKKRPLYGPLVAIPTRDDKGSKGAGWALVWVEALPPPFAWPADKAYKRRGRHECGGGPTSRSLASKSVEKRFHVTRFEGTKQTSDKVVLSNNSFDDESSPFLVRPTDQGVEINGLTYDRNGKSVATRAVTSPPLPPSPVAPDEQVIAANFDAQSGEGAVVYWSGDRARWRRFDGQGKPKGKSVGLAGDPSKGFSLYDNNPSLTLTAGGWWMAELAESQLMSLDRDSLAPGPQNWVVGFFPGGDSPGALEVVSNVLSRRRFDPKAGTFAEQTEPFEGTLGDFPGSTAIASAGIEPSLITIRAAKEGAPAVMIRLTASSGQWSEITGSIPEEIGTYRSHSLHQVLGDVVLRVEGTEGIAATWLRVGKTRVYPKKEKEKEVALLVVGEQPHGGLFGPLVNNGTALLPPRPGALIETPDLEDIGLRCEQILHTAPGLLTLVCAEALSRDKPGTRLGIQTYRFHE